MEIRCINPQDDRQGQDRRDPQRDQQRKAKAGQERDVQREDQRRNPNQPREGGQKPGQPHQRGGEGQVQGNNR